MDIIIKEIKAHCKNSSKIEQYLKNNRAVYKGLDHQIDTYFNVRNGRLKMRIGSVECNLIHYLRTDVKGMKSSEVELYENPEDAKQLLRTLVKALGVKVKVEKKRKIYFIDNVKFHIDEVKDLGSFVEIEAIGKKNEREQGKLSKQCAYYVEAFNIKEEDMIAESYSDMLLG